MSKKKLIEKWEARVTFSVVAPEKCSKKEFEEWLEFEFGIAGELDYDNPLEHYSLNVDTSCIDLMEIEINK